MALALEPRMMFDGAVAATTAETLVDTQNAAPDNTSTPDADAAPATATIDNRQEVVFVDSQVRDYQQLLAQLPQNAEVVVFDAGDDGLQVIADTLGGRHDIDAIHVLSHGDMGQLQLGSDWLDSSEITARSDLLTAIGQSLGKDGDILLYGCSVGADGAGFDFVRSLASATGADIAASSDLTGAANLGGDWELEVASGTIEAAALELGDYAGLLTAFTDPLNTDISPGLGGVTTFTSNLGGISFTYTFTGDGDGGDMTWESQFGDGDSASVNLLSGTFDTGTTERVTIARTDAADFTFSSLYINNTAGQTVTVQGYLDGTPTGSSQTMGTAVSGTLNFGALQVDEVRLTSTDFINTNIDSFSGNTDPPAPPAPTITSATYNAATGVLIVTGTDLSALAGAANDIDASRLTLTGEGGSTYTLTDTSDVEISSSTSFSLTLSATDQAAINPIFNKNGTSSTGATTYNLAAADDWNAAVTSGDTSDSANAVTVSNVAAPTITSATYDASTGVLAVTGTGMLKLAGANNDIDASQLTFTGEGGSTYTLTNTSDVEITSGTSFTLGLSALDKAALQAILNNNGTSSAGGTLYNLAAADDWNTGADSTVVIADTSGNTITVSNFNAAPVISNLNGDSASYLEGASAVLLDNGGDATLTDADSADFNGGNLSVAITSGEDAAEDLLGIDTSGTVSLAGTSAGSNLSVGGTVIGTLGNNITAGNDLLVNFNANATLSRVQTLVRALTYQNSDTAEPTTGARNVRVTVNDGDGGTSANADITVSVTAVNDEPTLTATGSNPTFTEGGAAASLFNGTSISTVEAGQTLTGFNFTVTNVSNGTDEVINLDGTVIVLTDGASGTTAGNSLTFGVAVSGTNATISLTGGTMTTATAQTLIDNISYQNNSNTPSTSNRVVTITSLRDSGGTANGGVDTASLSVASTVTVVGVNDAPTLTATGSNPTFTEGGAAASLFSGVSVSTVEPGQSITALTLTVSNLANGSDEILDIDGTQVALTHGSNGTTATNALSYSVSVVGTTATVSLSGGSLSTAAAQTLVDNLGYLNNSEDPGAANRVVTLTSLTDSGGTANGGDDTASPAIASTVSISALNDAPTLSGGPLVLTGTDEDSTGSGTLVSTILAGLSHGDVDNGALSGIAIRDSSGNGTWQYSTDGIGWNAVGSVSDGAALLLSSSTQLRYIPDGIDGESATLSFRAWDQTSGTASTNALRSTADTTTNGGTTAFSSGTAQASLAVTAINDAPTLTATGINPTYIEGDSATDLFSGVAVDSIEPGQNIFEVTLTVSSLADGADEILRADGSDIALIDGNTGATAGTSTFYSVSVTGTTATVELRKLGGIDSSTAATLIDGLGYRNNSETPSTGGRTVTLTGITDVGGTTNGGNDSTALAIASTVTVTAVNDAPTLAATGTNPTFIEGGSAVDLFSGVSVSTVEAGQTLSGLTLTLTNLANGSDEILDIDGTQVALTHGSAGTTATNALSYSVSVVGTTATVSLSGGSLSTAAAQTLVDSIGYLNNSQDPDTSNRTVTLTSISDSGGTANGGDDTASLAIASTVSITALNDAPTLSGGPLVLTGTDEDSTGSGTLVSTILAGLSHGDVDGGALSGIAVSASSGNGTWQYSTDGIGWNAVGSITESAALLLSSSTQLRYVPDGIDGETATLSFRAWDQTSGTASTNATRSTADTTTNGGTTAFSSGTAQASLAVTAINDVPTLAATGTNPTFIEGDSAVDLFSGVSISTVEAGQTLSGLTLTVSNLANGSDEILDIDGTQVALTHGSAGTTATNALSYSVSVAGTTATVSLSGGSLSTAAAQTLVDNLGYLNNSEDPGAANRVVTLTSLTDSGGTANGGDDTASLAIASTASISALNDAPTLSGGPLVLTGTDEDSTSSGTLVSTILAGLSHGDVDNGALSGIAIRDSSGNGTWQYSTDGIGWNAVGSVSDGAALLLSSSTQLRYIPDGIDGETATLSFRAWDQTSGTASSNALRSTADTTTNGGTTAFSSGTAQAFLNVAAVNDAPVNTVPGAQATLQNQDLVFDDVHDNRISIADVDAGGGPIQVTLTASAGLVSLSATTGLAFSSGDGRDDSSMTFSGTLGDINAALDGLTFMPTPGFSGAASLQITTDDLGRSGSGGSRSDSDTVAITVFDDVAPDAESLASIDSSPVAGGDVHFDLRFSEPVTGLDSGDFSLVTTGNATGELSTITALDERSYRITVSNVSGGGTLGIRLNAAGSGISDAAGNPLSNGLTSASYQIAGNAGDPEFRAYTGTPPVGTPAPLRVPIPPPEPPSDRESPLLPPALFDEPTLGSGVPTLGAFFDAGGTPTPSVIAQVFAGRYTGFGDGSGRGFLGFGGGDAGVFGVSGLSEVFQQGDEPEYPPIDAFGSDGGDQSPPILGVSGAPTLEQQLSGLQSAEDRAIGLLAEALEQFRPADPKA
ncbi:hypothetical protein GCM10011348_20750 [Marinobacterium nitratireducens]|uniref:DUF4347 domain-containing protein n=1 Tax=Marinobacterium nitratireducens TaxID=518897 RepID=A0A917ZEH3_9GAMM|nr:hypothetical protein GCM10011348_20750 [Marinobacterium nitratireducens]